MLKIKALLWNSFHKKRMPPKCIKYKNVFIRGSCTGLGRAKFIMIFLFMPEIKLFNSTLEEDPVTGMMIAN